LGSSGGKTLFAKLICWHFKIKKRMPSAQLEQPFPLHKMNVVTFSKKRVKLFPIVHFLAVKHRQNKRQDRARNRKKSMGEN
jgi:hypothetical protein